MTDSLSARLDAVISSIPAQYPGPGGAIAVLRDGEVLVRHTWGYANAERRIPFTPASLFRMCSITKQFTCAMMLENFADPTVLDGDVDALLPQLDEPAPGILHLAHNQSGLRDYWAVAMLHGAPVEGYFGDREAARVIAGTRTLQFQPGTSYSYVNQNFRLISDIVQERKGRSFGELLQSSIFDPVGMERAILAAETRTMPDGTVGYEGTVESGFRPAKNNIWWTGDAGLGASLDDMIAWERFIDRTRHDTDGLYNRLTAPVTFDNGTPAPYGFGLQRTTMFGRDVTMHGGALRGWRSHRLHVASERISIVVMFNHMSPAQTAAAQLLGAVLDATLPEPPFSENAVALYGTWLERETGLSARIQPMESGIRLRYLMVPEYLDNMGSDRASNPGLTLAAQGDEVRMERPGENRTGILERCDETPGEDIASLAGVYRCEELDEAEVSVELTGGVVYGGFSGILGDGRMEPLQRLAKDVWVLPCPRALDHTAPGDWTLAFERHAGEVTAIRVGCWLARDLIYQRV
ncbi:D-aminopeptidase [Gluconobacter wancherniae]|uniref:D-aminopeptidase n=1 Tax=Gluconobacter wancherniae TaxID=1307955 RepID=UPI001B8A9B9D|nr:D-aminopeptidase [Gluconobacter wancherniae]MBS1088476.1 D-aminopeptidase [Gluconobacter wancherniae]